MTNKLSSVSMNGRMAYTIMCVESFLVNQHPDRDWSLVAKAMWESTSTNWGDWPEVFSAYIPCVMFEYNGYNEDLAESYSEETYNQLLLLYDGITDGNEDDASDEVNYMINLPYEMAMVYEGTTIGDGTESFEIIQNAESILEKHGIPLPDYHKVLFSSVQELNGWGNDFDGSKLSVIL